ncbi:MAG: hypothetical protein ACFE9I_03045 [Candidatus Hermodarchaeota archaeon]
MTEDALKARIRVLEEELERKNREINDLLDRIEEYEETIMRLEALIPEEDHKKKSKKQQAFDSKMAIQLDEKDKKIRELKNSMGFLRKEKVQLQQELQRIKSNMSESSVIRVEDLRSPPPLNALVKELQDKINKQQSLINKLKSENANSGDIIEKLKDKDEKIEILKFEISGLNQKLKDLSSSSEDKSGESITKKLIEDLQKELHKSKIQANDLKQKLIKFEKKDKKELKNIEPSKIKDLTKELDDLKNQIEKKDNEIKKLKDDVIIFQKTEITAEIEQGNPQSGQIMKELKEDLQNKLNKAKIQIKSLQEELKKYQGESKPPSNKTQKELEGNLKMQREMAMFLQKQLETKEAEIETIKNEAVQIKTRYRQLENQVRLKDRKIEEMQSQYDSFNIQPQIQPRKEDSNLKLRLGELKNMVDELKKENIEQRIEISQLRKKS